MQFTGRKRRHPPAVIIIALIDVLIVVLIFLIVTTTFRQHPAVNLALPEARQGEAASALDQVLVVTIPRSGPIYLQKRPVTMETLERELVQAARQNPATSLSINADTSTPVGQIVRVMDSAKAANIRSINLLTREGASP